MRLVYPHSYRGATLGVMVGPDIVGLTVRLSLARRLISYKVWRMATLYVVATPIGNLEDITLRALRVLKEVDFILCEDTRITKRLLVRYEITTPVLSYHAHSTEAQHKQILKLLSSGKNLALVSDAGTPTISDPGSRLIELALQELEDSVSIVTIPGPNALIAALSISGVPASEFYFLGFLPHKKGRESSIKKALSMDCPVVLYESPHRIEKMLVTISKLEPGRVLILARELTKIYEEVLRGTADELRSRLSLTPEKKKGEFVVIVTPK